MNFKNNNLVKIISLIVALVSLAVIIGWFFNIEFLRTIIPGAISMRFLTAVAFLGTSIFLYSLARVSENNNCSRKCLFMLIISSFFILFIMLLSIFNVLGVNFSIEKMINPDYVDASQTFPVLVPSISTIVLFILIGFAGLINIFFVSYKRIFTKIIGILILITSLSVLFGYLFNIPLMYFALKGISNAMAVHTGILFLMIGFAFILISKNSANNHNFTNSYTIAQKLMIGFTTLICMIFILMSITLIILNENNSNLKLIKEVEDPLALMVEQVIGYDAILTGSAHWSLLHVEKNELDELKKHKALYDDIGLKLDTLLKKDAILLLEKSKRGNLDKEKVYGYLAELDRLNLALVDLELRSFEAMERGDFETAYGLIVGEKYESYKSQLSDYYLKWAEEESRIANLYKQKNLNNLRYIFYTQIILVLFILLAGIFLSRLIFNSILNPLKDLDYIAQEIGAGNLNVKSPPYLKKMPGIIGDIAISYATLLQSSHFALKKFVESKIKNSDIITGKSRRK